MILCQAKDAQALDKTVMPGVQGGPLMHVIAAKAVAFREALTPGWHERMCCSRRKWSRKMEIR